MTCHLFLFIYVQKHVKTLMKKKLSIYLVTNLLQISKCIKTFCVLNIGAESPWMQCIVIYKVGA